MLDKPVVNAFAHVKAGDTPWVGDGLRSFFEYRDLGIAAATGGRVIAQLARAKEPPEAGTGWHRHAADFPIVIMQKGWAKFMYEDKEHLVEAGDCVHQRPGITHFLFDYSPDMEYLEVVGPAEFGTVEVTATLRCRLRIPGSWAAKPWLGGSQPWLSRSVAIRTRYRVRQCVRAPSVRRRTTPACPAMP
jgi:mannose-6-phosphate isomerase-like protein (cupin superfamily)